MRCSDSVNPTAFSYQLEYLRTREHMDLRGGDGIGATAERDDGVPDEILAKANTIHGRG